MSHPPSSLASTMSTAVDDEESWTVLPPAYPTTPVPLFSLHYPDHDDDDDDHHQDGELPDDFYSLPQLQLHSDAIEASLGLGNTTTTGSREGPLPLLGLVGVVGPSFSGKSTFLNLLSRRLQYHYGGSGSTTTSRRFFPVRGEGTMRVEMGLWSVGGGGGGGGGSSTEGRVQEVGLIDSPGITGDDEEEVLSLVSPLLLLCPIILVVLRHSPGEEGLLQLLGSLLRMARMRSQGVITLPVQLHIVVRDTADVSELEVLLLHDHKAEPIRQGVVGINVWGLPLPTTLLELWEDGTYDDKDLRPE